MPSPTTPISKERVVAEGRRIALRVPGPEDRAELLALRRASWSFLAPWEAEMQGFDPCSDAWFERYLRTGPRYCRERWLVVAQDSGAIRGSVSLADIDSANGHATLGYWIGERFARQGYMGEALELLLAKVSSAAGLRRLDAYVLAENEPSKRLLEKLGFERSGTARDYQWVRGELRDHERWRITCPSRAGSGSPG